MYLEVNFEIYSRFGILANELDADSEVDITKTQVLLGKNKMNQAIIDNAVKNVNVKASIQWKVVTQGNQQNGWNCFDVAVGMERQSLVKYVLENAGNIEFRQLIAPEIRHAAAITAVYMVRKKEISEQEKQVVEERTNRIIELFQIAEALKGESEQAFIEAQTNQLLRIDNDNDEKQELEQLIHFALPKDMHTEALSELVNDYYDAHEAMKETAAKCNEALGYGEGKRLSLEELDKLFSEPINREKYQEIYESFAKSRAQIFELAEQRFKEYCASEDIYKAYVQGYYGANKWFAFQRHFAESKETSMVDITACYLNAQIFIHNKQEDRKIIYHTKHYGIREIHVEYNGVNHFLKLEAVQLSDESLEEKDKPENSKESGRLLWLWNQVDSSKVESQNEKEVILKKELAAAYDNKQYAKQCTILAKLAEHHLQQKKYSASARLLNGAIVIFQTHKQDISNQVNLEKTLLDQLKQIEACFVKEQLKIDYRPQSLEAYGINLQHKNQLIKIRKIVKEQLQEFEESSTLPDVETSNKIQQLFKWIAEEINSLLHNIVQECISLIQMQPPCDYALIGTGSLARNEMTPYSDLEYFILVAEDSVQNFQYFTRISQLLEIKVINLGETDLVKGQELLPLGMLSPVQQGFSLDIHKTPSNEEHILTGTPIQMARYQLPEQYVHEPINHLSSALLNGIFITGSNKGKDLLLAYQTEVDKILNQIDPESLKSLRLIRTFQMLKNDIDCIEPQLRIEDEGKLFRVKNDFYRLPQISIDALALYIGLRRGSPWDKIDELCTRSFITTDAGHRLKQILSQANEWRLKTYLHYNGQREFIDVLLRLNEVPNADLNNQAHHRGLESNERKVLTEAYKILIPLHECMEIFYKSDGKQNPFAKNSLDGNSHLISGRIAAHLCKYPRAKQFFLQALSQNSEDGIQKANIMNRLGAVCFVLDDIQVAIEYYKQALAIRIKTYGFNHVDVVTTFGNLAAAWNKLGRAKKSLKYYKKTVSILINLYGFEHPSVAENNNHMANIYRELGNVKIALSYSKQVLPKLIHAFGFRHPQVAVGYNSLGLGYQALGEAAKAVKCYEQASTILAHAYGREHPLIAANYNNLGAAWQTLGDDKKSIKYFEQALAIDTKIYGSKHSQVAKAYNNLGAAWKSSGDLKKAISYFKQAFEILSKIYGREHFLIAANYNNLGAAWQELGGVKKAMEYYQKALIIFIKISGHNHPNVAACYSNLGTNFKALGKINKAVQFHKKALEIKIELYGPEHPSIAISYNNLGSSFEAAGNAQEAIEYYEKALKMRIKIFGDTHPEVAVNYDNLGVVWGMLGDVNKALEYHKQALTILTGFFDLKHPDVIICENNLQKALRKVNNNQNLISYKKNLTDVKEASYIKSNKILNYFQKNFIQNVKSILCVVKKEFLKNSNEFLYVGKMETSIFGVEDADTLFRIIHANLKSPDYSVVKEKLKLMHKLLTVSMKKYNEDKTASIKEQHELKRLTISDRRVLESSVGSNFRKDKRYL